MTSHTRYVNILHLTWQSPTLLWAFKLLMRVGKTRNYLLSNEITLLYYNSVVAYGYGYGSRFPPQACNPLYDSETLLFLIDNETGVIGSDVPWLECPACNAFTWVITVTE